MRCNRILLLALLLISGVLNPGSASANTDPITDSLRKQATLQSGKQQVETYLLLVSAIRNTDPAGGIDLARQAIKLAENLHDKLLVARLMNAQGICYRKLFLFERALMFHFDALNTFEKLHDSMGMAFSFANIGQAYLAGGDLQSAHDYQIRALEIKLLLNDDEQIAYSCNALGLVLMQQGKPEIALEYFNKALALHALSHDINETANIYGNIGKSMTSLGSLPEAIAYLHKAEAIYTERKDYFGLATTLNRLAEAYGRQGENIKALELLKKAEHYSVEFPTPTLLYNNYQLQGLILEKMKDYQGALRFEQKSAIQKDSINQLQEFYELQEIKVRYETNKLDADNEILRLTLKEQDLRLKSFVVLLVGLTFFVIAFFFIWRYNRNRRMSQHLEEINQSLEQRVEERTRELQGQISAREEAFHSLRLSEEKFKAIAETTPAGVALTNVSGEIIFVNNLLTEITGLNRAQFMKNEWISQVMVEDRNEIEKCWFEGHQNKENIQNHIFRIVKVQTIHWFHLKAAPIYNGNSFLGMVAIIENITTQKEFEQQLIKSKNKAEESDKLKSAFLANMSHEIRTPMNAILGFSDLLSSNEYDESEKIEFINMIRSSGKLLLNLINDIIDISKIEAGEIKIQPATFTLSTLLEESYHTFKQQLEQSGKTKVQLILNHLDEIGQAQIFTDKLRLQQIMTNLLSNAIKFTKEGEVEFGALMIGEQFQFYVRDSGIGIPESKLDVIFERFRQADDSHTRLYGGTGLGLAITRNLTELLGGKIWVESVQKRGTVFYFTLPAGNQTPEEKKTKVSSKIENEFAGKTILVVEDVETNLQLIISMLKKLNTNTLSARNGFIALDIVSKNDIDLVLMDVQMPELDGIEAMKKIRETGKKVPVIAITGFSLSDQESEFIEMGFDAFISKPFTLEILIRKFRQLIQNPK